MEELIGFLKFESFISLEALMVFYYLGAVLVLVMAFWVAGWLLRKLNGRNQLVVQTGGFIWSSLSFKQKIYLVFGFIFSFLFMQLLWRMMFEFLIAYMQIHAALVL